jgi:hypothetical protein
MAIVFRVQEYAKHEAGKLQLAVSLLVSCAAYSLTLKAEAIYSSEMSVLFRTAERYSGKVFIFIVVFKMGLEGVC